MRIRPGSEKVALPHHFLHFLGRGDFDEQTIQVTLSYCCTSQHRSELSRSPWYFTWRTSLEGSCEWVTSILSLLGLTHYLHATHVNDEISIAEELPLLSEPHCVNQSAHRLRSPLPDIVVFCRARNWPFLILTARPVATFHWAHISLTAWKAGIWRTSQTSATLATWWVSWISVKAGTLWRSLISSNQGRAFSSRVLDLIDWGSVNLIETGLEDVIKAQFFRQGFHPICNLIHNFFDSATRPCNNGCGFCLNKNCDPEILVLRLGKFGPSCI